MKKESNAGLFFLLAVGIVGLGLYFGAAEDYSRGELQLYHIVCWAVLIAALLRVLELVWEPVRALWDLAWGKTETEAEKKMQASFSHGNEKAFERERFSQDEEISRADGVIIMPDRGSGLYLDDSFRSGDGTGRNSAEEAAVRSVSHTPAVIPPDPSPIGKGSGKKKDKKKSKKKDRKKKKKQ